jgi:diketogulonate reductase-like aldo/keto reductase
MAGSIADTVTLTNGVKMPMLGLGTWKSQEGQEVQQAIRWALEIGYRHIDTAAAYGNEKGVGEGLRSSGVPREQVFVTTKLWNDDQRKGYDACMKAFDTSLSKLGMDYVDLYLVHWPVPGKYKEAWRAVEKIYASGRAKAIGVSNFMVHHLDDLLKDTQTVPMVNQVEFHPWLVQKPLMEACRKRRIVEEAWSPLMRGKITQLEVVTEIANRKGKTPAQVVLRWNLQHGVVTIPKSVKRDRLVENASLYDFELTAEEMARIDALDKGERVGPNPDNFTF